MENKLDISALIKAHIAFNNALDFARKVEAKTQDELEFFEFEIARSSLIKHFEFSYEMCWKTMNRYIKMDIGAEADILTRRDLFRLSAEKRLIADFDAWVNFHQARNRTSHVYNEDVANEVYETAKIFSGAFDAFIKTMGQRI